MDLTGMAARLFSFPRKYFHPFSLLFQSMRLCRERMQKPPTISSLFWLFPKLAGHYTTQVELIRVEDELNVFQVRARVCVSDCFVDDPIFEF